MANMFFLIAITFCMANVDVHIFTYIFKENVIHFFQHNIILIYICMEMSL